MAIVVDSVRERPREVKLRPSGEMAID